MFSRSCCFGDTQIPGQQTAFEAENQERWSWGLYDGIHNFVGPAVQPESFRLLLKRLKPRLDHDAAMQDLVSRIKKTAIPALDFRDAPVGALFDRINELIRIHNEQDKASWIPPVALRVIPDDFDKPEPSPTDFRSLNSDRISLALSRGSVWDAIHYVTQLANLWIVPEPNAIWLVFPSFGGQVLTKRSYVIPKFVFSDKKQEEATLRQLGMISDPVPTWHSWNFDEKSRVLTLSLGGHSIDTFELWYAHELLKHGYVLPSSNPEGAIDSSSNSIRDSQTPGADNLQGLTKEADAVMAMVCAPGTPG